MIIVDCEKKNLTTEAQRLRRGTQRNSLRISARPLRLCGEKKSLSLFLSLIYFLFLNPMPTKAQDEALQS
jgi:hypothetical protein